MTLSEELFERLCNERKIRWKRIIESDERRPDYDIYLPVKKVVVEVKEIGQTNEHKAAEKQLKDKGVSVVSMVPGDKVRKKITNANVQIKNRTKSKYPGLLVLFDRGFYARYLDPYQIRVAMYGFETMQFAVPNDLNKSPYVTGTKYGGNRKMTFKHNTSISAIGVLHAPNKYNIELDIYHNVFAKVPLELQLFKRYRVSQYILEEEKTGSISDWQEI